MTPQNLITKLLSPLILAGSLVFSPNVARADHWNNDWENIRDWYLIQQGIINPAMRYAEYELMRESIRSPRDIHVYHHYDRDNDGRVDAPDKTPQTFVANYWKDFNEDGNMSGVSSEIVGLNKKTFKTDENLIYGVYLPLENIKGRGYDFKLFDKNGRLVNNYSGRFERNKEFRFCSWDSKKLSEIVKRHGEGTYSVAFYFDGRYWNKREFELLKSDYNVNPDTDFLQKHGQRKFIEQIPKPTQKKSVPTPKPSELVPVPEKPTQSPTPKPALVPKKPT